MRRARNGLSEHLSVHYAKKALPLELVRRVLRRQQRAIYRRYAAAFPPRRGEKLLDLGTNGSLARREQYFFHASYPYPEQITAAGLEPSELHFQSLFPRCAYVQLSRDGPLPFEDGAFDVVHCNAVIEHVGDRDRQRALLTEIVRIGKSAFITTPNRWYPIELHTVLPLVHYLPTRGHRWIFEQLGFSFFAKEENLNLLDRRRLRALVPDGPSASFSYHYFLGLPSNIVLVLKGRSPGQDAAQPASAQDPELPSADKRP